tara:strand:- start:1134 stop:1364 length:231 start_codon:yes stop_codon:yes gene_type:complete
MGIRRRKNQKMNVYVKKLIGYSEEDEDNISELQDTTDFSFTEVQRMINNFFFSDVKNLDEVFGEEEEVDDEEEDEE